MIKTANILAILLVLLLLVGTGFLVHYKFTDCRKVGHSVLYCVLDLG